MAKRPRRLPLTSDLYRSVHTIIQLLDQAQTVTHFSTFELFNRALGVFDDVLHGASLNQWMNKTCVGLERGLPPLALALNELIFQAMLNYQDILGLVYMQLGFGNPRMGQYFTPYNVSRMMSEMTLSDIKLREPGEPPFTICDPCCGSGIMLLVAMEVIENLQPSMLDDGSVLFYGMDIDATCVRMARLNMSLHWLGRNLRKELSLSKEQLSGYVPTWPSDRPGRAQALPGLLPEQEKRKMKDIRIQQTDGLTAHEREIVERATGIVLPTQVALPFGLPDEEAASSPPSPGSDRKASAPRRGVQRKHRLEPSATQERLFVVQEPLFSPEGEVSSTEESVSVP